MVNTVEEEELQVGDEEDEEENIENGSNKQSPNSLHNQTNVLISKPPSQPRDVPYSTVYLLVLLAMVCFTIFKRETPLSDAVVSTKYAGTWASHLMISPIMGTFCGVCLCFLLFIEPLRHCLLSTSTTLALTVNIGLSCGLFFSKYWIVGVFLLLDVYFFELNKYRYAKANMDSSLELVKMAVDLNQTFELMLIVACFLMILAQACVLLWWAALFVSVVSKESLTGSIFLAILFLTFLYLITQFFRMIVGAVVGGSYLWLFLRDQRPPYHYRHIMRQIMMYVNSCSTASIGTICKAAIFIPPCQTILTATAHLEFRIKSYSTHQSKCTGVLVHTLANILQTHLQPYAKNFPRLSLFYVSTYGHSLNKAASVVKQKSGGLQVMSLESTGSLFDNLTYSIACLVSVVLLIIAENEETEQSLGPYWPLFFTLCFLLSYSCIAISLQGFCSATDALILSFAEKPELFEEKNAILYHRWLRINEIEMA